MSDEENVNEKVISLLNASLTPYISDFKTEFSPQSPLLTVSDFDSNNIMIPNQICNIFCFFSSKQIEKIKHETKISFSPENGSTPREIKVNLDFQSAVNDSMLIKMALHHIQKQNKSL